MTKIMMVLTFMITLQVHAVDVATCIDQGNQYLVPNTGLQSIDSGCNSLFLSTAPEVNKFTSEDGKIIIHAYKNIIFMKVWDDMLIPPAFKEHYTTGPQTELTEVHFVEVDEANRYVTVLANDDNSVLNYRIDKGGNVAWMRKLAHTDLEAATAIATDTTSGHLLVLYKDEGRIVFYKRFADINGRTSNFTTEVLGEVSGPNSDLTNPVDACVDDSLLELYVFDGVDNKIRVYNQGQMGDIAPKRTITPSSLPAGSVVKMDCHNSASELSLSDASGNNVLISK